MTRQTLARSAAGLAAVVAVAGGYAYLQKDMISRAVAAPVATATATTAPAPGAAPVAVSAPMDFSGIVDRYGPAVVNISTTAHAQRTSMQGLPPGMSPDDPFSEFFKRFMPQMPQQRGDQIVRGLGSGFIVSADGLILTNAHVVDGAQEVNVKLTDRREFKAKVLGVDKQSDVAVLRISAKNLPVVQIGSPANTKVGEPVLAIGSPYGFENTVTAGIVSAKSRSLPDDTYVPFIQTDVAVNPGNSGGPLFNQRGQVIGINSQIYSQTGGYQGLSFAVPIDVAMKVEQQLVSTGKVTRGRLGIAVQEVDQSLADSFKLPKPEGALVNSVEDGGPAAKAGLQPGDVILQIGDARIDRSGDLPEQVADIKPGSTVPLQIIRQGKPTTLTVTVGAAKDAKVASSEKAAPDQGRLGLAVRPLQPEEKRQNGLPGGLVVMDVTGPAAKVGIQPGDVILSLNGTPVSSVQELRTLADRAGKHVALLVQRDDTKIFVPVDLG
ncbi:DegQ family serine endoprotease [Ralstonia sp. CHL-2022]|uniref:Probable periplasmic serine endoprotease DegP-like n=1 Tax=Ralstonia mojiangensis TaxID=2953895 RepID=A0ABT2LAR9_9RALS|nr:DegQ family serine endoprotease [Ralstonia mojiangensis]MCT7298573.1 DegQ family serine endoprotease [Ralstonia mojiangensis]MCT7311783.1 DegQ family serine endoprotease [Ralstonia mojiangensis]